MRYAIARYNQHQRDLAYRIFVTDCLRIMTENTAITGVAVSGGKAEASAISVRFSDIVSQKPTDKRTADDIIKEIKTKLE